MRFAIFIAAVLAIPAYAQDRLTPYRSRLAQSGSLREIDLDGHKICFQDIGRGPAVFLLHGLGGSLYDWRHIAEPLAMAGRRVVVPDFLGAGESAMPSDGDYSVAAQARRVRRLMEELKIDRAALVGNSYGGGVALAFAQDWPALADRLVLIDSVCYAEEIPLYVTACSIPVLPEWAAAALPVEPLVRWTLPGADEAVIRSYADEIRAPGRPAAVVKTVRALVPLGVSEWTSRLKKIRTPALVLWGAKDETIPVELGRRLAADLPSSSLCVLEGSGHTPNQDDPEAVLRELERFLKK